VLERLARFGYVSIGVVYLIAGALAAAAGLGQGGGTDGQDGAVTFILGQPFGRTALAGMALSLVGYTVWRIVSAINDAENRGGGAKGLTLRAASLFRGLIYAGFAIEITRLLLRGGVSSGSGGDQQARHWAGRLLDQPFGSILLAIIGLGVVAYGAYQIYSAIDSKLSRRIRVEQIDGRVKKNVLAISRFGIAARGLVFFTVGGSIVMAALQENVAAMRGTSGALRQMPDLLLFAVGAGLASYGIYAFVNARYRQIDT
jgi:hypothetical protein